MGLYPIRINFVPQNEMIGILRGFGGKVLEVQTDVTRDYVSCMYYVTKS